MMRATLWALPAVFAVYMPTCTAVAGRCIRRLHQKIADGEHLPE
jgi:hypothetical protein